MIKIISEEQLRWVSGGSPPWTNITLAFKTAIDLYINYAGADSIAEATLEYRRIGELIGGLAFEISHPNVLGTMRYSSATIE